MFELIEDGCELCLCCLISRDLYMASEKYAYISPLYKIFFFLNLHQIQFFGPVVCSAAMGNM